MTDQPRNREAKAQQSLPADQGVTAAPEGGVETPQAAAKTSEPTPSTATTPATTPRTANQTLGRTEEGDSSSESSEGTQGSTEGTQGSENGENDEGDGLDEARTVSAEEFAREHDPVQHDVAAGEELRQRGDWTADEAGGPQVWDADGNLVEGTSPAQPAPGTEESSDANRSGGSGGSDGSDGSDGSGDGDGEGDRAGGGRRTSSLDEVRDGGYSVGSAALIEGGAMPLGHPVKAWEDTKTFVTPDDPGYDEGEPDLWFTDAGAARRSGFGPAR